MLNIASMVENYKVQLAIKYWDREPTRLHGSENAGATIASMIQNRA
jgi:hypothetical protein